jgi:hypothetical protein
VRDTLRRILDGAKDAASLLRENYVLLDANMS